MKTPSPCDAALLCGALSLTFAAPQPALLRFDPRNPLLNALGRLGEDWERVFEDLWAAVQELGEDPAERALRTVEIEYARLFLVPSAERILPFEHAHRPVSPGALGAELRRLYRQAGLDSSPSLHELPDHVATELEFLARLLDEGSFARARHFSAEHLRDFLPSFAEAVRERTTSSFFRTAADALERIPELTSLATKAGSAALEHLHDEALLPPGP